MTSQVRNAALSTSRALPHARTLDSAARTGRQVHWEQDPYRHEVGCVSPPRLTCKDWRAKQRTEREFTGTLIGFDEYVNIVLDDVKE